MTPHAQQLQAVLFLSADPVQKKEIIKLLGISSEQLSVAQTQLESHLESSGLALLTSSDCLQLTTSPAVAPMVTLISEADGGDLSAVAAETLAIVAYRGPIIRADIDAVRGVDSSRSLRILIQRSLILRARVNGRYEYRISADCMRQLGLTDVTQLPNYDRLSTDAKVNHISSVNS